MTKLQFIVTHETNDSGNPYESPFTIRTVEHGYPNPSVLISAWRHSPYTWKILDHATQKIRRIRRRYKSDAVDVALFHAVKAWNNENPSPGL